MFLLAIGGLIWIAAAIFLVRGEFWQTIFALPGSFAFLVGLVGGIFSHVSIH